MTTPEKEVFSSIDVESGHRFLFDFNTPEFHSLIKETFGSTPSPELVEKIMATARLMEVDNKDPAYLRDIQESSDGITDVRTKLQRDIDSLRKSPQRRKQSPANEVEVVTADVAQEPAQLDLFNADVIIDYTLRDEINGMSIPMYALAKKPDRGVWRWDSPDGRHYVEITSKFLAEQLESDDQPKAGEVVHGRATIFDKDIIIYSISKINEAMERGLPVGATIRFTAYDFFKATKREPGGKDYENMMSTLRRLRSTNVETNVIGSDGETTKISGIIDEAEVKRGLKGELQYVEVTLARWLFAAIKNHKVLGISPKYFELTRPLERALYSIARKHVGQQAMWKIGLQKLKDKCGAAPNSPLRNFLIDIKKVIEADNIPDYRLALEKDGKDYTVTFYSRDAKKVAKAVVAAITKKGEK